MTARPRRATFTAFVCALLAVAVGVTAPADAGDPKISVGLKSGPTAVILPSGSCEYGAKTWAQEHGKSGVTRLRTRYELRRPQDVTHVLPTIDTSGWARSAEFPDDDRSYYNHFYISPKDLVSIDLSDYTVRAKAVGERPSFWQRDLVWKGDLGTLVCTAPGVG